MPNWIAALLAILGAMASTEPACAQATVRAIEDGEDKDRSYELPWRSLQSGELDIHEVVDPCVARTTGEPSADPLSSPTDVTPKYLGGTRTGNCVFGDLVRIDFDNILDEPSRCTGVLIAINLVLTAAHCTCGKLDSYTIRYHRLNETNNADPTGASNEFVLARAPDLFQGFSCQLSPELQAGRDLAILSIEKRSDAGKRVGGNPQPDFSPERVAYLGLSVATTGQIFQDNDETKLLVGAGYGETDDGGLPEELHVAAIPIASLYCGAGRFADSVCSSFREFVLADGPLGLSARTSDSCVGDSGSPIFYMPPDPVSGGSMKTVTLVGITSRALSGVRHRTRTRCGGGGIYTSVGHPEVIAWLRTFGIPVFNVLDTTEGMAQ
ncbi:trypsin-like serine protease [Hyphomicrobium sp.]|uniref:trypsin-like serine protease n=1 Tax=Hyphomicrobium sp. TaxID=82 RepID=UPI0025C36649|nr:trypsin-like serine protease [Hyphomicrobium sp.]MCC7250508.1 trypsin-like serine protease [Hyphomicrobium sp.]